MMTVHEPMDVQRVPDPDGGSHVEPPLDVAWTELDRVRWAAGLVRAETGVTVRITTGTTSERHWGRWHVLPGYGYQVPGVSGGGSLSEQQMHWWLQGFTTGHRVGGAHRGAF